MPRWLRIMVIPTLLLIALAACVLIVVVVVVGTTNRRLNPIEALVLRVQLVRKEQALKTPIGRDATPICFKVNSGDNANSIGAALVQSGFINDADLFKNYVRYYGIDAQLQAGTFSLRKNLTLPEIAQLLTNVGANTVTITTIEGRRIEETATLLDSFNPKLAFSGSDFLSIVGAGAATRADYILQFATKYGIPLNNSFEGFLFPDTYELPACAKADQFVHAMLNNFDAKFTAQMQSDAVAQSLTPFQVITLASIVEREAVKEEERPTIASVYLNRFRKPMKLDADPTVQYPLGNTRDPQTWWPRITSDDYQNVKSPYNTYLNIGLPPGPISSAGMSSIQAVLHPQDTPFFYFRASCSGDGSHQFAVTFEEQVANGC
jgi:UPF0755 protein